MSEKYMKIKRIIIPTITMVVIASQLFGCSSATKQETYNMLQDSTEIELEYAVPDYDSNTEESKVELLPWLQLSSLETHPELRTAFEEFLGITGETGNKEGVLYYNPETKETEQNATLYMATKNSAMSAYFTNIGEMEPLINMAAKNYTDVEPDDINAPYVTINAYFELLPDQEEGQFNGDATISRAQAMTLVMRATTPVNESQAPEEDADFTAKVGETQYTNFAAPMDEYAYLNTENGLNEQSFNGTMTKGEYICMVTNYLRADYLSEIERLGYKDLYSDTSSVTIITVSDAGNIKYNEAIEDAVKGVPTDMYKTFKVAIENGYIDENSLEDWDSALTKTDAFELFITMTTNANTIYSLYSDYTTPGAELNNDVVIHPDVKPSVEDARAAGLREDAEIEEKWADADGEGSAIEKFTAYARSQGASGTSGWSWIYTHGEATDESTYAVYMKEDSPLYGTVYHVGDYLPDGDQLCGTIEEYGAWQDKDLNRVVEETGLETYKNGNGDTVIVID